MGLFGILICAGTKFTFTWAWVHPRESMHRAREVKRFAIAFTENNLSEQNLGYLIYLLTNKTDQFHSGPRPPISTARPTVRPSPTSKPTTSSTTAEPKPACKYGEVPFWTTHDNVEYYVRQTFVADGIRYTICFKRY